MPVYLPVPPAITLVPLPPVPGTKLPVNSVKIRSGSVAISDGVDNSGMKIDSTQPISEALRAVFKRLHYPIEIMLTCVRWYVAYPLSLRHIKEMMAERSVKVDRATIHRWALKMLPILAWVCRRRKSAVGRGWRMALGQPLDETYVKVTGQWKYRYRAVDRQGDTLDFLFSAKRDRAAARRFLGAIGLHGLPDKISIDKSMDVILRVAQVRQNR